MDPQSNIMLRIVYNNIYFLVHNTQDLKMQGNCIKGSRPVLSFDGSFTSDPFMEL